MSRVVYAASRVLQWVAQWGVVGLVVLVVLNVCLRLLLLPSLGLYEAICFFGAIVFVFSWAPTQVAKGHLVVNIVLSRLSQRTQSLVDSFTCFIGIGVCFIYIWASISLAHELWHSGELVSMALPIPIFPIAYIIAFGTIVLFLVLLIDLAKLIVGLVKK